MSKIKYRNYQGILVADANDLIDYVDEHGGGGGGVTKAYVDQQDTILQSNIDAEAQDRDAADMILNNTKQATLVSGQNIKTVNGYDILGSGNINVSAHSSNEIVVSSNTDITKTGTLSNLFRDLDNHIIMQFSIDYESNMTSNPLNRFAVAFDYINKQIVKSWKQNVSFNTGYFMHTEYNTSINKFVIAVRNTSSASDTKDLYVEFNEDGTTATITFAKTNVTYVVASNPL